MIPVIYKDTAPTDEQIMEVRNKLALYEQKSFGTYHDFYDKFYLRMVVMDKGDLAVGRKHMKPHIVMIRKGSCKVWDEDGVHIYTEGMSYKGRAGIRRVVLALEDLIWMNVHPNDTGGTDLAALEADLVEPRAVLPDGYSAPQLEEQQRVA